jgi:glycogen debranching enzyme
VTGTHDLSAADVRAREEAWQDWRDSLTRVEMPLNTAAERIFQSNAEDVASFPDLTGAADEWLAPQAGMPLYPAFFGRDAITVGWQIGCLDGGRLLDASLRRLGRLQSDRFHEWTDEEPGRIPYQVRSGPLALLELNPYAGYYADYASPLMFVISLANLFAWTGDRTAIERHWDTARRICDWARTHGDADGDGYLEYLTRSTQGTKNQGWKDSGDAIVYDDGSPVPAPIATCELQGYWYIAQELMAVMSFVMGDRDDASEHRASAAALKERFNRDWWLEEQQCVALALDPDKRPVRAVTSNVGHCLAAGIIDAAHMPAVVERLFAPDMFSGWGIRTLSSDHAYYNPISYHRGSVWAVEQATVIFGLRRFGFDARALELTRAVFDLAALYPQYRIPECVGGYARHEQATPGAYPRANTPQLWNAGGFPLILQTLLGLVPLAPINTLIIDPRLPPWLPEVIVRDMRVGDARVTLRFRLEDGRTDWAVLHTTGTLHVVRQPPPESLHAGVVDRIRALVESVWR